MFNTNSSITYSTARNSLASLLDRVALNTEVITIVRRGKPDVALISKEELDSLLETVYLLGSPNNAVKLNQAIAESKLLDQVNLEAQSVNDLCEDLGIER